MKSDLDLIIDFYEEEKLMLAQAVKEALKERDYELVYQRGEALNRVEAQLYRMKGLKDPLYESIKRIDDMIASTTEPFAVDIDEQVAKHLVPSWQKHWTDEKEKLKKMRAENYGNVIDKQIIDDALFDLYEGNCRAFAFCFPHRDGNLCLLFELTETKVLLISVDVKDITSAHDPEDPEEKQVHLFENLGFYSDNFNGSLVYQYDMSNFKSAWEIKILLARIIYDIGYLGQEKQATLEFYD